MYAPCPNGRGGPGDRLRVEYVWAQPRRSKGFFAVLNVFYTFDSDPPNPDAARTDVGIVVSIGWSY